jgi:hypothetical protein
MRIRQLLDLELMRWMPPPSGISYAMMVPWEPNGGRIDDDEDQHAGDRPGEGQLSGLRRRRGWGGSLYNRVLSRTRLAALLAEQPACVVAMEACATSHHWGRVAQRHGHEVRLVPAAYVKPFVKRHAVLGRHRDPRAGIGGVVGPEREFGPFGQVQLHVRAEPEPGRDMAAGLKHHPDRRAVDGGLDCSGGIGRGCEADRRQVSHEKFASLSQFLSGPS